MPIYDYLCLKCKKVFTEFVRVAEIGTKKPVCPKCNSEKVKKQISTFHSKTSKKS